MQEGAIDAKLRALHFGQHAPNPSAPTEAIVAFELSSALGPQRESFLELVLPTVSYMS